MLFVVKHFILGQTGYSWWSCYQVPVIIIGLTRTVYMHHNWPYIWKFRCQKYRKYTVYIWFGQSYRCILFGLLLVHASMHILPHTFGLAHADTCLLCPFCSHTSALAKYKNVMPPSRTLMSLLLIQNVLIGMSYNLAHSGTVAHSDTLDSFRHSCSFRHSYSLRTCS